MQKHRKSSYDFITSLPIRDILTWKVSGDISMGFAMVSAGISMCFARQL